MHLIKNKNQIIYIEYSPIYKGLNVVEFGEETNTYEHFTSTLCYRNNHIVHFVLDGQGEFYCNNRNYQLSAGQAFVITPKDLIKYGPAKNDSWTYCWLAFSGVDCDILFKQCGFNKAPVFTFNKEIIEPLLKMIENLRNATPTNKTAFSFTVAMMANDVLRNIVLLLNPETTESTNQASNIIAESISYMYEHFHRPINISTLCKELHISRGYFSTIFEASVKQSPYRFLQNIRLQRATELLLKNPSLRVYEIAEIVGFSSTAQFCKAFKKNNNLNPLEYRKKYLKNVKNENNE